MNPRSFQTGLDGGKERNLNTSRIFGGVLELLALSHAAFAQPVAAGSAQGYPSKPIRLVVPYAAGGSLDTVARPIAQSLANVLGQQIIVDNRGGAGGTFGCGLAARAPADGYTLLMGNVGPLAISPSLQKVPYDTAKDFVPISQVAALPLVLFVGSGVPVNSVEELVAHAKARPAELNYASPGTGSGMHLAMEMFKNVAKVDVVHVPFPTVARAMPDIMSGRVHLIFGPVQSLLPHVKAEKLKALAVASTRRDPFLPEVPTTLEIGMPELQFPMWYGILAPAGTPKEVVRKLYQATSAALSASDLRSLLMNQGVEPIGSRSPEEFAQFVRAEAKKWRDIVKISSVKVDY